MVTFGSLDQMRAALDDALVELSDRALRVAAGCVALAGMAVAGYLTWVRYDEAALVCVAGGGCETVQQSSYAEMAGIPVALLGLLGYAVCSDSCSGTRPPRGSARRRSRSSALRSACTYSCCSCSSSTRCASGASRTTC